MNNLSLLRMKANLTQRAIAKKLHCNESTYCRAENGWFAKAPEDLLGKLQRLFGPQWSWEDLMAEAPTPIPASGMEASTDGSR